MANGFVSFASGAAQSRTVRYYQNLTDPFSDVTWINSTTNILTTDIFGNPVDFNKDGKTDALFLTGSVNEYIGYTTGPGEPLLACTRNSQGEIALGGGGDGSSALRVINLTGSAGLCGFPNAGSLLNSEKAAVLDLNNDGYQDIYTPTGHSWIYDPRTGELKPGLTTALRPGPSGGGELTLADFNGDKVPDMAWTEYENIDKGPGGMYAYASSYKVYFGVANPDGSWNLQFEGSGNLAAITLDIDPITNSQTWLSGSTITTPLQAPTGAPDVTPIAKDLDGDGDIDLAVATNTGIRLFTNPGNGKFVPATFIDIPSGTGAPALFLKAADFNNDGLIDLISSPNSNSEGQHGSIATPGPYNDVDLTVYLNASSRAGISMTARQYAGLNAFGVNGPIAVGDMNLDGFSDLVMAPFQTENDRFAIALGDGTGQFSSPSGWQAFDNAADPLRGNSKRTIRDLSIGDFNGDGQMDVASMAASSTGGQALNSISGVAYNTTFAALQIATTALPKGREGSAYTAQLTATGGDASRGYSFVLSSGSNPLPVGLALASNGLISGTPKQSGSFSISVDVTQGNGLKGAANVVLQFDKGTPLDTGVPVDTGSPVDAGSPVDTVVPGSIIIEATKRVDHLIGSSASEVFAFPTAKTGQRKSGRRFDTITHYEQNDQIQIRDHDVVVMPACGRNGQASRVVGQAKNLRTRSINRVLGSEFEKDSAGLFTVNGENGSFLAINTSGNRFDKRDIFVHLEYFDPSPDTPLTFL